MGHEKNGGDDDQFWCLLGPTSLRRSESELDEEIGMAAAGNTDSDVGRIWTFLTPSGIGCELRLIPLLSLNLQVPWTGQPRLI